MAFLKNTDFERAVEQLGLSPLRNTAVWLKVGVTFGSPLPNYAVAQFTETGVVVFGVSPGGSIVMPPAAVIPIESDDHVQIRPTFGGYRFEAHLPQGVVFLRIRKLMIGAAWHTADLANVLERFGSVAKAR